MALSSHCVEESPTNSTPSHLSKWLGAGKSAGWEVEETSKKSIPDKCSSVLLAPYRGEKILSTLVTKTQEASKLAQFQPAWPFVRSLHADCLKAEVNLEWPLMFYHVFIFSEPC